MNIYIQKADFLIMAISCIFYVMYFLGVLILYKDLIKSNYEKWKMRYRLRARRKSMKPESLFEQHIRRVLSASMKKPMKPNKFIRLHIILFIVIIFVSHHTIPLHLAIMCAALMICMPYLLFRVRLESQRRKGSYEGEKMITEFIYQYRINGFNIYNTVEHVIQLSEDMKISGKLLFKLLLELRNTGNAIAIKRATDDFAYGYNTNWSKMLANNIRIAAESGINITFALEDILIQMREARIIIEERKRLNSEAVRMVVFLMPLMYFGTVITAIKFLDITPLKFLKNQLYTEQGFFLFLLTIFLFLLNVAIIEIVHNQRFDY